FSRDWSSDVCSSDLSGDFALYDLHNTDADGNPVIVLERSLRTLNSYNVLDNLYATRVSRRNILEISLNELSDQVVTELSLFFKQIGRASCREGVSLW